MKRHSGFTLVEIMIVVAVIGILSAVAIPFFNSYFSKAKVAAGVAELSAMRPAFQDVLNQGVDISSPSDLGGASATTNCSTITAIGTAATGVGTLVCFIGNASAAINGQTITWSRGAALSWSCSTTVAAALAPSSCPGI